MNTTNCACCSGLSYADCCKPFHQNKAIPASAEALMRSRYCAYALHLIDYLVETTHKSQRHLHAKKAVQNWAVANIWLKLEICEAMGEVVEFKAYYQNGSQLHIHHERSTFKLEHGKWYYLSGQFFD
ncbi:YchJ family protein [Pedobacter punctiformis]|uniref:YchJ family protein n=1 Tax=Pedobacter punctiformis TaxID=3004097 RepID=A0ABT4L6K5_9SPHI|nr:YchJ family protein [Pedobacter sp. HCMS5-2]MCZ4243549.1 YchJ family protein [Pedobacter sp. HCMS5-2]